MPYNVPDSYGSNVPDNSGYAHHQPAEPDRVKEAQEFQRQQQMKEAQARQQQMKEAHEFQMQQQKAADAARKAAKVVEEQRRAREMAAADQAARMRAFGQRY